MVAQRLDQHGVGIPIHYRLILDVPGTRCVLDRAEGLFIIRFGRADTGDHGGARVASKTVLQYPSQFRVTVRDETLARLDFLLVCEGGNYVSEGEQALINVDALLQGLSCRTSLLDPLGACQVNKVELGRDVFLARNRLSVRSSFTLRRFRHFHNLLLNRHRKDGVGAR